MSESSQFSSYGIRQCSRKDIEVKIIVQAWQSESYKQELLQNPKAVIEREMGSQLPADIAIHVLEETPTQIYLILPVRPDAAGIELSQQEIEAIAGGLKPSFTPLLPRSIG